jgi:hypothetical protein
VSGLRKSNVEVSLLKLLDFKTDEIAFSWILPFVDPDSLFVTVGTLPGLN